MNTQLPSWLEVHRGEQPLVVCIPHAGIEIPSEIEASLESWPLALRDTDWFIDELHGFAKDMGATIVRTRLSRTVVDVNRDPSGASLYPGFATTELCATTSFDGVPLYKRGMEPSVEEVERKRGAYHKPFHEALEREIRRLRSEYDAVVVYDGHSIRSKIPRLFDGELPHFNIGTNDGVSCDPALSDEVEKVCRSRYLAGFSTVVDGRFKGGWITRRCGRPESGVHAIHLGVAIRAYMPEPAPGVIPERFDPMTAGAAMDALQSILDKCLKFARRAVNQVECAMTA